MVFSNEPWKRWARCYKILNWIFTKIYNIFTFGYYIRLTLESYQYILITSIAEIYDSKMASIQSKISFFISVIIILIWVAFLITAAIMAHRNKLPHKDKRDKFAQYFEGIKHKTASRYYVVFLLARRIIFVSILITLGLKSSTLTLSILTWVQIAYLASIIILRPFIEIKDNIVEIINEIFFSIFLGSLFKLNSKEKWSNTYTKTYIYLIISNNMTVFENTCVLY